MNIQALETQSIPLGHMQQTQAPLRQKYLQDQNAAQVVDWARTSTKTFAANNPLRTQVTVDALNPTDITIGVHQAVGGLSDAPTPGDLLCGALACCFDSTIRIIANLIGIELTELSVEVKGHVDVRGTLMIDKTVPVRFQRFDVNVSIDTSKPIGDANKQALLNAAENSCIVMQTIKGQAAINLQLASGS